MFYLGLYFDSILGVCFLICSRKFEIMFACLNDQLKLSAVEYPFFLFNYQIYQIERNILINLVGNLKKYKIFFKNEREKSLFDGY